MRALKLLCCLAAFLVPVSSSATPIEVFFTGTIDAVVDPGGLLPAGIGLGSPFSGTYVFDSISPGPASSYSSKLSPK